MISSDRQKMVAFMLVTNTRFCIVLKEIGFFQSKMSPPALGKRTTSSLQLQQLDSASQVDNNSNAPDPPTSRPQAKNTQRKRLPKDCQNVAKRLPKRTEILNSSAKTVSWKCSFWFFLSWKRPRKNSRS